MWNGTDRWFAGEMQGYVNEITSALEAIDSISTKLKTAMDGVKIKEGWDKVAVVKKAYDDVQAVADEIKTKKETILSICNQNLNIANQIDFKHKLALNSKF